MKQVFRHSLILSVTTKQSTIYTTDNHHYLLALYYDWGSHNIPIKATQ